MATNLRTTYRLESKGIRMDAYTVRTVWFLDKVEKISPKHTRLTTITNGDYDHCQRVLETLQNELYKEFT
jgi:hypothetical protein